MSIADTIVQRILKGGKSSERPSFRDQTHEILQTVLADPQIHRGLLTAIEGISEAFGLPMPRVYVSHSGSAAGTCIFAESCELIVPDVLQMLLSSDELKAVLGHEMHHFKQKPHPSPSERVALVAGQRLTRWADQQQVPGHEHLKKGFKNYLNNKIAQGAQREAEADFAGAQITSPDVLTNALVKIYAHDFGIDLESLTQEEAIQRIDRSFRLCLPFVDNAAKAQGGDRSFVERLADLHTSDQERPR